MVCYVVDKAASGSERPSAPSDTPLVELPRTEAPPVEAKAGETPAEPAAARTQSWRIRIYRTGKWLLGIAPAVSLMVTTIVMTFTIATALFDELYQSGTPFIGTISMPEALQKRGYTPDVLARKIGDAYQRISEEAQSSMRRVNVSAPGTSGDIAAQFDSTNIYALSVRALRFLGVTKRREISGEVTENAAGRVSLTLRIDGDFITAESIGPNDTPEELLEPAAFVVLRHIQPYIEASWEHGRDPERARLIALDVITRLPEADPNVAWAHILLGRIHYERGETELAIQEYQTAIRLDSKLAVPHYGLGTIHHGRAETELAIQKYQTAIRLDPKDAVPHYSLGLIHYERGETESAIQKYQTAIRLDPKLAPSHYILGLIHQSRGETELAIQEYQTAIRLDSKDARSLYNLALALIGKSESTRERAAKRALLEDACSHAVAGASLSSVGLDYPSLVQTLNGRVPCPAR
jgi:tetratricopeptide (TPR) repeat protein